MRGLQGEDKEQGEGWKRGRIYTDIMDANTSDIWSHYDFNTNGLSKTEVLSKVSVQLEPVILVDRWGGGCREKKRE